MTFLTDPLTFTSSLTPNFIRQAELFRREQKDSRKARQVYLNTLAVQAVHFYCTCIGVETDLATSDSWSAPMRTLIDVADLVVKVKGKLECRPVLPGEEVCPVPPETLEDRIGYVVVEINEENYEARLLGFSKTAAEGILTIKQMSSLDTLIDAIVDDISETVQSPLSLESLETELVKLEQWFRGVFDEFWQDPRLVPATIYRGSNPIQESEPSSSERVKFLDVGDHKVALVVKVTQIADSKRHIFLKIFPINGHILPPGLLVQLLDDTGSAVKEIRAGNADNINKLNFRIGIEEMFSVKIGMENNSITVQFLS